MKAFILISLAAITLTAHADTISFNDARTGALPACRRCKPPLSGTPWKANGMDTRGTVSCKEAGLFGSEHKMLKDYCLRRVTPSIDYLVVRYRSGGVPPRCPSVLRL